MNNIEKRVTDALNLIVKYGGIDGAHHKDWVLDQVVRALYGNDEKYKDWVLYHDFEETGPPMPSPTDDPDYKSRATDPEFEKCCGEYKNEADYEWSEGCAP